MALFEIGWAVGTAIIGMALQRAQTEYVSKDTCESGVCEYTGFEKCPYTDRCDCPHVVKSLQASKVWDED